MTIRTADAAALCFDHGLIKQFHPKDLKF